VAEIVTLTGISRASVKRYRQELLAAGAPSSSPEKEDRQPRST
jgi:hypothetical protein